MNAVRLQRRRSFLVLHSCTAVCTDLQKGCRLLAAVVHVRTVLTSTRLKLRASAACSWTDYYRPTILLSAFNAYSLHGKLTDASLGRGYMYNIIKYWQTNIDVRTSNASLHYLMKYSLSRKL